MTEAVREVADIAFRLTDIDELRASVLLDNPSSRRVLEKAGFAPTGRGMIDAPARSGQIVTDFYRLSREAWLDQGHVRDHQPCRPEGPGLNA